MEHGRTCRSGPAYRTRRDPCKSFRLWGPDTGLKITVWSTPRQYWADCIMSTASEALLETVMHAGVVLLINAKR
jgi:hypothetical protein